MRKFIALVALVAMVSIVGIVGAINPAPELVNGWHPTFSNDIASNNGFWHQPALKCFNSGNFPTTAAELASGEENPLGSVSANFGMPGSWKGAQPF